MNIHIISTNTIDIQNSYIKSSIEVFKQAMKSKSLDIGILIFCPTTVLFTIPSKYN